MEQLEKQILKPDKIVLQKQNEVKKQLKHIGSLKMHKGQKMWELNTETIKMNPVEFKQSAIALDGSIHREYVIKEKHWYCVAINLRNAERKFLMMAKKL